MNTIELSLNEIDSVVKQAARGANFEWGMAEEAGKAARRLSEWGFDGPALLLAALDNRVGSSERTGEPRTSYLCPLTSGVSISDFAADIPRGRVFEVGPVYQPLVLAPFAAISSCISGTTVELTWDSVSLFFRGIEISTDNTDADLTQITTDLVRCRQTHQPCNPPRSRHTRGRTTTQSWGLLQGLASRTFAPETPTSLASGAGAGTTDND